MDHTRAARAGIEGSAPRAGHRRDASAASRRRLRRHEEALARLDYVTARRRGFALLTGPAGAGKSVLLREFADGLRREGVQGVVVDACGCGDAELVRECCDELGLGCSADGTADALRFSLVEALRGRCAVGTGVVLILDHADRAEEGAARLIERLLHATHDLAGPTIVAACREPAPPALASLARDHADLRIELSPLTLDDAADLIATLHGPGERYATMSPQAVSVLNTVADGELRQVNRLWRLLQTAASAEGIEAIDEWMVDAMACELPA